MAYLKTLPSDEAIALVTSLQKVKEHLTEELDWMNQQLQQKTTQLQGIETLLAEADSLGLTEPGSQPSTPAAKTAATPASTKSKAPSKKVASAPTATPENGTTSNGDAPPAFDPLLALTSVLDSLPTKVESAAKTETAPKGDVKPQTKAKAAKTPASSSTKEKKPAAPKASSKPAPAGKTKELRELLAKKYQDKTFGEIADELLTRASKPVHVNDLVKEMYGNLSEADSKRARLALTKLLSAGKMEGKWQSIGQGVYAANGVKA
ncbi:MAG TPA: hypothetical protein IGS53_11815 [Leptolyngbyaceae cyanobacterium M33_DOE_097]|uniref:Uncharacterized protein n=1 Tax=Oscillatoriales cyanobacterium SpSt-418 TaxID=2282169 RepID=A0A7C3PEY9_9CYAN|nr:hypothetical protein [Leptolyngbyaceae cyanobacterium M33_DOE_097]